MTDLDVAKHYNLPAVYPEEWPAALDESDGEAEDEAFQRGPQKSFALERENSNQTSLTLGSQQEGDGRDNLVQKDEPDPLGSGESVVRILTRRGIPVDGDLRLRNKFLLSSTSFSPALFLARVHPSASTQSLLDGLDHLSRSIDQKSASLKVLVEANFERFVRAKATIDSVYTEMRNQGAEQELHFGQSQRRSLGHYRSYSSGKHSATSMSAPSAGPRKNALTKESEYGMKSIRAALVEASMKAEEVWGPALSGRERERALNFAVATMEKNRDVYEVGGHLSRSIRKREYEAVVEHYTKARYLAKKAKLVADAALRNRRPLTDEETCVLIATGKMWLDVDQQIRAFKRDLWRRLSTAPTSSAKITSPGPVEEHMELIGTLLQLGAEDNPIWIWLLSRFDFLKTKITSFNERAKVEIEILRRRLASVERPAPERAASYLRLASRDGHLESATAPDADQVIELWECIHTYLKRLLSSDGGLLGELAEFWDTAQSFIDGSMEKLLPPGFEEESRKHYRLSADGTRDLRKGVIELANLIRESVLSMFADPPIDDISLLASPIVPPSPGSPMSRGVTPTESRFKLDPSNLPVPTPKRDEPWGDYAFWPPWSNSLSGVAYLSKFLGLVGTAASEMAALISGNNTHDQLKTLVSVTRERAVRIICSTWNKDAESCRMLEDWTRDPETRDRTKMPSLFMAFETAILSGIQKILYVSDAMSKPSSVDVVTQPPAKLLQMVRTQFVSSVYKALSGLVENAERPSKLEEENEWVLVRKAPTVNRADIASAVIAAGTVDAENKNVRILLTLSNIKALQTNFVPQLITNFETSFSVKLTEEAKTIRDVLNQIDNSLFQLFTKPIVSQLESVISAGITASDWVPTTIRPEQVRPYVYDTMLILVLVHTEISTTIPSSSAEPGRPPTPHLLNTILSHLLTQVSSFLLTAFSSRDSYSLSALMQATLDIEFIAQTMSNYASNEASSVQSQIYVELDRRTTLEARAKLQAELAEMRKVLKRLRERTKGEFACFKKHRSGTGSKAAGP